jgi:aminoglycoside phosphotransferase (APT) family kinase protein
VLSGPVAPVLNHHDYGADHILVADGRITAIIDWELAGWDEPARDLAWWRTYGVYMGGGETTVRAGYGPPDAALDERIRAWALALCVGAAAFDAAEGHLDGVTGIAKRARRLRA